MATPKDLIMKRDDILRDISTKHGNGTYEAALSALIAATKDLPVEGRLEAEVAFIEQHSDHLAA